MIRAESFHLEPPAGETIALTGKLAAKAFRGENWLLQVTTGERQVLFSIPATRAAGCEALTPGSEITAWAARDHLHVVAREAAT
nr:TOBE domain-containing protein [Sinirhodobacter populi]